MLIINFFVIFKLVFKIYKQIIIKKKIKIGFIRINLKRSLFQNALNAFFFVPVRFPVVWQLFAVHNWGQGRRILNLNNNVPWLV